MSTVNFLAQEKIWFDKPRYDEAERRFYERMNGSSQTTQDVGANTILQDIARARENIQKSLAGSTSSSSAADQGELISRIKSLELENQSLHKVVDDLRAALSKLECRVTVLEKSPAAANPAPAAAPSVPYTNGTTVQQKTSAPVKEEDNEDDDDIDLFGSDDDEEAEKLKEQRLKEYAEKKAKKPTLIAKSSILLDVKPWDDETDMAKLEECVRSVQADGLLWGTSKLVPVGYGIKKLQIACVVEDDKVGTDMLEEEITKFEDYMFGWPCSVDGTEADATVGSEPHCRVERHVEFGLHPVQEMDSSGCHHVEAEQTHIVVQEHPDPAGYRSGGNFHRLLLVSMTEDERGRAALEAPGEIVVSQPAVIR